jgi:hypothetical protein
MVKRKYTSLQHSTEVSILKAEYSEWGKIGVERGKLRVEWEKRRDHLL